MSLHGSTGDSSSREVGLDDLLGKRLQTVIPWAGVSLQMNLVWPSKCFFSSFFRCFFFKLNGVAIFKSQEM